MPHWITTPIDAITEQLATVTPIGWTVIGALTGVWLLKRFVSAKRKQRPATKTRAERDDRMARWLLSGALVFLLVVLVSFAVGTFAGGSAFALDKEGWKGWMKIIPSGALDASTVGFSLLSLVAIIRKRSPKKPMRIAIATAAMSAVTQMMEGGAKHTWQGGLFLAFLAVMLGLNLDVIIDQLRDPLTEIEEPKKKRIRPPFGWRWLTSPTTLFVWLAWINYPPEGLRPTVANALLHRDNIRAEKWAKRLGRPAWLWLMPWIYASRTAADLDETLTRLRLALTEQADSVRAIAEFSSALETNRTEAAAESVRVAERISELNRELNSARERTEAVELNERNLRAQFAAERTEAEQANRAEAERAEQTIAALRTEVSELSVRRTEPASQRRTEPTANRAKPQSVGTLVSDAEIASRLQKWFGEQTELTGKQPTRYRIELTAPCSSRQADRVLILLANRYDELKSGPNGTENRGGRESNRTGEPTADDLDHELIELTGS